MASTPTACAPPPPHRRFTLGGLLKHLAVIEDNTFTRRIGGNDMPSPWKSVDWDAEPDWE